jgi:hypothetical protein
MLQSYIRRQNIPKLDISIKDQKIFRRSNYHKDCIKVEKLLIVK